jgi:hypothetical protein
MPRRTPCPRIRSELRSAVGGDDPRWSHGPRSGHNTSSGEPTSGWPTTSTAPLSGYAVNRKLRAHITALACAHVGASLAWPSPKVFAPDDHSPKPPGCSGVVVDDRQDSVRWSTLVKKASARVVRVSRFPLGVVPSRSRSRHAANEGAVWVTGANRTLGRLAIAAGTIHIRGGKSPRSHRPVPYGGHTEHLPGCSTATYDGLGRFAPTLLARKGSEDRRGSRDHYPPRRPTTS